MRWSAGWRASAEPPGLVHFRACPWRLARRCCVDGRRTGDHRRIAAGTPSRRGLVPRDVACRGRPRRARVGHRHPLPARSRRPFALAPRRCHRTLALACRRAAVAAPRAVRCGADRRCAARTGHMRRRDAAIARAVRSLAIHRDDRWLGAGLLHRLAGVRFRRLHAGARRLGSRAGGGRRTKEAR